MNDKELRLEVTDYLDANHWRWRLSDSGGKFLADYEVSLNPTAPEYSGFLDLESYLEQYAAPDKWPEDEVRLVNDVGAWIGSQVLGPVGTKILRHGTPVTVRVIIPPEASGLLFRPLELTHAGGRPLALQDVSLVFEVKGESPPVQSQPIREQLRVLAIFSLPTDVSALALRRERYELNKLMHRIAKTHVVGLELRVLQYGVTRKALQETLEEGEGWDVIHFSGHGLRAGLILEKTDGTHDLVPADDVATLLRLARGRLKLVTLSSCLSAAATVNETLTWLGIPNPSSPSITDAADRGGQPISAVARALVREVDCAVLAMRYSVGDDFAISLAAELYERVLGKGQRLARALQLALPAALRGSPHPGVPPLSVAAPALFGRRAVQLTLNPPRAEAAHFAPSRTGLAYFPPEPERFVGRAGTMARASAALAPESDRTGVLFYGMAGAGKTACALELAYRYEKGRFGGFVWHKAPDEGSDIDGALLALALDMEKQLPELEMAHIVDKADEFATWLPLLTELLEQQSILIVLDNLESLLTPAGAWRDERWSHLVVALLAHHGLSRTVLTSRRRPVDLDEKAALTEPVHALSLSESALLARELPNHGRLLRGETPVGLAAGRELVSRTLAVVQGHPKLIELAEGQASDPKALAAHLERVSKAWAGSEDRLQAFFREGKSSFEADEFLAALVGWTHGISAALPAPSRTLFHFLSAMEEGDRQSSIVEANWADLWRRLGLPGGAPELAATLAPLKPSALVEAQPLGENQFAYNIHPGIAEAGRTETGGEFQAAVDVEMAAFWTQAFQRGLEEEMRGGGAVVVQAGRRAAPYLIRRRQWEQAATLLEHVIARDRSPSEIAALLPLLRRIVVETEETRGGLQSAALLAKALARAGRWREAELMMREIMHQAAVHREFRLASAVTGALINILRVTGRTKEALDLVEREKDYIGRAKLGPWTQLSGEGRRLQLLTVLGRNEEVVAAVEKLREQMRTLPEKSKEEETAAPWNVREAIFNVGANAAGSLGRWEVALALNAESLAVEKARGAPALDLARTQFSDYKPLIALRRYEEARNLLQVCKNVFEDEKDLVTLGKLFTGLADLEDELGHPEHSVGFEQTALRYTYPTGDAEDCAVSHNNLSIYMERAGRERKVAVAHRLAAAVLGFEIGSGMLGSALQGLALDFAASAPDLPPLPASFDELCRIVEAAEGVRFRALFERLPRRATSGEEALKLVVAEAQEMMKKIRKSSAGSPE